jgi:hypothetical protein
LRREFGVAERRECAGEPCQREGEDNRGSRIVRGRDTGHQIDTGADDGTHAQQHQTDRTERALKRGLIGLKVRVAPWSTCRMSEPKWNEFWHVADSFRLKEHL